MDQHNMLQIGSSINIKRTDGRVHSAIVAAINFDQKSATVEWFEQGETKGKEIDMSAIESLNPDIVIRRALDHPRLTEVPQMNETAAATHQLQRDASGSSDEDTTTGLVSLQLLANSPKLSDDTDDYFNCNQSGNATMPNPTRQSIGSYRVTHDGNSRSALPRRNPTQFLPNNGHTAAVTVAPPTEPLPEETTSTGRGNVQNSRRGKVVQEVEKLKRNREERRQRQAEEKAEKEAFLQLAPGNPHWELLNMILEYRRSLDIKPLSENDLIEDHLITVCVRKRPLNKREATKKEVDVITIPSKNQLIVHEPKLKVDLTKYLENQLFRFDYAFDETCTNDMVYRYTAQPLIKTIFEGGFATCFAYGQTGSGKTHTMGGDFNGKNQDCQKGIYAMVSADVFKLIHSPKYRDLNLLVSASFFEIYSGKVFDLLNNKAKLRILEDGKQQVQVVGLTEKIVHNTDEVLKLIQKGNQARTSGQTFANSNSSRSHAVFQIYLRKANHPQGIHGKFSLIDLAGNERGADTSSADRQTRMEGAEINKSLLALKECIRALGRKGSHLPFRVSKLTQVLRDSFVGSNSRTCMIAMVSPGINSCEHTLNTLRYADRVKELGGGDLQIVSEDQGTGDDLQRLRSLNENDMTPEMLNFHEVISQLEEAEELMLDNHKNTVEELLNTYEKAAALFGTTNKAYYDSEGYCSKWKQLIDNMSNVLGKTKELIENYEAKMSAEEQLSRATKHK